MSLVPGLSALARLKDHLCKAQGAPFLLQIVKAPQKSGAVSAQTGKTALSYFLTPTEAKLRQQALLRFHKLPSRQKVRPSLYNDFLRQLYPRRNSLSRFSTYKSAPNINHALLFHSYSMLPSPGVGHLAVEDMEPFIAQMLARRDFVKPNALSPRSMWDSLNELIIWAYRDAKEARKRHLAMFWKILRDMEAAGIPVSKHEQKQLVFMTFYRERPDIRKVVEQALSNVGKALEKYPELAKIVYGGHEKNSLRETETSFDMETYGQIRNTFNFDLDTDMHNVFLQTAFRHDNLQAVEELLAEMKPDGETFRILFDNYSMQGDLRRFHSALELFSLRHLGCLDIRLFNSLVAALVRLNHAEWAFQLAEVLESENVDNLSTPDRFLRLLSQQDREQYRQCLSMHQEMENLPVMRLHPTQDTFFPLLVATCQDGLFEDIQGVLARIQKWHLPLSSRVFETILHLFLSRKWLVENLRYVTAKLITEYDVNYGETDSWIRTKLHLLELPPTVSDTLGTILSESPVLEPAPARFLKLSDRLITAVFQAFEATLHPDTQRLSRVVHTKAAYLKKLGDARARESLFSDTLSARDLYRRDEYVYIKKGYLIDLLDIVSE